MNYKFKLIITSQDIYNKLTPEQKEQFRGIQITNISLCDNQEVIIDCLALEQDIIDCPHRQKILGDGYISID